MRAFIQLLFPKKNLDAVPLAIAGFLLIGLLTKHSGIGVSPDSVVYMSVARNIADHGSIVDFNARPLVVFPAFFPMFLATILKVTGKDPMQFAPLLNGILFAILIYVCGWIMEFFTIKSRWHKFAVLTCLVLSPCLLEIYSMLWSETLFILLLLFFMISLHRYLAAPTRKALAVLTGIVAVACITRYAGVTLVGTGALLMLLNRKVTLPKRFRHLIFFVFTGVSLLAINLLRNITIDGTGTGMRERSLTSFQNNLFFFGNVLCDWLPIPEDRLWFAILTGLFFFAAACFAVYRNDRKRTWYRYENIGAAFFVVYSAFIILSATFSRYEGINSRLLSPIFIPFVWIAFGWIAPLFKHSKSMLRISIAVIAILFFGAFQLNQYRAYQENYEGIRDAGIPGYTEDTWRTNSEIVNFLRKEPTLFKKGFAVYSNADDALYFFTNMRCDMIPHKVFPKEISDFYAESNCYLVWFNDNDNPELISLQDILSNKKMTLINQFSNGAIYVTTENTMPLTTQ